jgi:hypothetical protein
VRRLLDQPALAFAILVGAVALVWAQPIPGGNETAYLTEILAFYDPTFLPGDWTYATPWGAHYVFTAAFGLPVTFLPAAAAAWLVRIVCWTLAATALLRVAAALAIPRVAAALALALWVMYGQSFVTAEFAIGSLEGKVASYAALFFGLDALLRRAPMRTGVCAGLAIALHPIVGFLGGLALGLALLGSRFAPRDVIRSGAVALLAASPGVIPAVVLATESVVHPREAYELYAMVRFAHHCDPALWSRRMLLLTGLVFAWNVWCWWSAEDDAGRALGRFQLWLLPPFAFGVAARLLEEYQLLTLTFFRAFAVLTPLVFFLYAARLLSSRELSRARLVALVLVAFCFENLLDVAEQRVSEQRAAWSARPDAVARAFEWVARNAEPDAVVIAPIWRDDSYLGLRRAQIVSWKSPRYDLLGEWTRRLDEFAPGLHRLRLPEELRGKIRLGDLAAERIREAYAALPPQRVQALASRYRATLFVAEREYPFRELHREDGARVYALEPAPQPAAATAAVAEPNEHEGAER